MRSKTRSSEKMTMSIPVGIESILYRAAAEPEFQEVLLADREAALELLDFELSPSELLIWRSIPPKTLETMVSRIDLPQHGRRDFIRAVAACALGTSATLALGGCEKETSLRRHSPVKGIRPERTSPAPKPSSPKKDEPPPEKKAAIKIPREGRLTRGIRPSRPSGIAGLRSTKQDED